MVRLVSQIKVFASQSLIYNAIYILGVNLFPALIGLAFWGVAGRLYSVADIGKASAIISAVTLIAGIAGLGTSMGVIRFLPPSSRPHDFLNTVYCLNIISSLVIGIIFLAGLNSWLPDLKELQANAWYFAGFLVFVLATTLGAVVRDTFIARRRASYSLAYTIISNSLRLSFIFIGAKSGAAGLVGAAIFAFVIALLISWFGFLPVIETGYRFNITFELETLRIVVPFSIGNYLANFLVQMPQTVLPMIIFQQLGAQANGYAYIALMLGSVLISPGLALASSAFAEGANDPVRSRPILLKASLIGVLSTLIVAAIVFVGAEQLLSILFGSKYSADSITLLRLLALTSPIIVLNQLYFTHLRLKERVAALIVLSCVIASVTVIAAFIFMPEFRIIASGIGIFVGNALVAIPITFNLSHQAVVNIRKVT